jgi:GTP pyrophosphokinase
MASKNGKDIALVSKAYEFAKKVHENQTRYSGEPYFLHVAEVGHSIAQLGMDADTIAAGLLHDSMEDAGVSAAVIEKEFSSEIVYLVRGVTKLGALRYRGLERHTESLRRLFAATAQDIRVLIIKLMDRLHNAKTLEHVPEAKRKRIGIETLEVYAPIAYRLGMSIVKTELEDAAFPHVYPEEYKRVREVLKERRSETEERLEKAERDLKRELGVAGVKEFRTESRMKGEYSLFRKLERKDWDISNIYDILALRLIVPSVGDCYTALGVAHRHWRPVPGKIKDYIAFPKPNGYQSIHTTVFTGDGGALEIQIRTETMHREAQYGVASHLTYKEGQGFASGAPRGGSLEWIRQFLPGFKRKVEPAQGITADKPGEQKVPSWVKELAGAHDNDESEDYMQSLKSDFFSHRVFVFTPKNDVIDLPLGATPIDFAYAIHTEVANKMAGAKVNGKMVALDSVLRNGDMVEILTKPSAKPSRKWLDVAKTTMAKKMIRSALAEMNERTTP